MRRRIVSPPGSLRAKIDSLSRLIANHGARQTLKGKIALCTCDLCKRAHVNLGRIWGERGG